MAVGKSNRIVVEMEPEFKAQIYAALKSRGLTFKEWVTEQAEENLILARRERPKNERKRK